MNDQHVKSEINTVKGKVKEEVGHVLGNEKVEGEGIGEQILGKVQKGFGDLKDAVKSGVDRVLNSDEKKH